MKQPVASKTFFSVQLNGCGHRFYQVDCWRTNSKVYGNGFSYKWNQIGQSEVLSAGSSGPLFFQKNFLPVHSHSNRNQCILFYKWIGILTALSLFARPNRIHWVKPSSATAAAPPVMKEVRF